MHDGAQKLIMMCHLRDNCMIVVYLVTSRRGRWKVKACQKSASQYNLCWQENAVLGPYLCYFPAFFELFPQVSASTNTFFFMTRILLVLSVDGFCFGYNTHNHVRQEHVIPAVMTGGRKTNWHAPNSSLSLSFQLQTEQQRMRDHVRSSHTLLLPLHYIFKNPV